ncbi:unnamed protein product [Orchesella dallaii]|uniref:Odorant receptor n=1 Tax=Orchesella dallaii TaxID=48710 RepID=A0ABP1S735_9HEXA
MLLTNHFLFTLATIHRRVRYVPGLPLEWDEKRLHVKVLKDERFWKIWVWLMIFLLATNVYSMREYWRHGDIISFSIGVVSVAGLVISPTATWFISTRAEACVGFFHGLIRLQRDLQIRKGSQQPRKNILINKFLQLFLFTELVSPPLLGIGCGLMTCNPLNLVKALNPRCCASTPEGIQDIPLFLKVLEFILNVSINSVLWKAVLGGGFAFCIHIFVGITAQCTALKEFGFQLRIYRRLYLLNNLFNHVYVGVFFVLLVGCTAVLTEITYIFFRMYNSAIVIPIPLTMFNLFGVIDVIIIILYVFGQAGCAFSLSKKVLEEERNACKLKCKCIWKGRLLASCRPIRIEFGVSNFIEKETPLKFIEFAILRFVDQILIH